jgi:hypothetical protein
VIERLPSKHEVLSSNPNPTKIQKQAKKKKKKEGLRACLQGLLGKYEALNSNPKT